MGDADHKIYRLKIHHHRENFAQLKTTDLTGIDKKQRTYNHAKSHSLSFATRNSSVKFF